MALKIDYKLRPEHLGPAVNRLFELSASKILNIEKTWEPSRGTPVFTVKGRYTSRGWTEWTQGFQFGSALVQFEATGEEEFLRIGQRKTVEVMAAHVSHIGVHDHGFNNISTYGNLWRLMREGKIPLDEHKLDFYELALKVSGAVQAARWTTTSNGQGFIYSFNGPHSLFVDTMRSLRSLAVAHLLGHTLMAERDQKISLLERLLQHAELTARYNIYYGEGRDIYDVRGRTVHETVFNLNDGSFRCPSTQQGYSPFSTWMRGLAWALLGFAEQMEFLRYLAGSGQLKSVPKCFARAATATADFYLAQVCTDGIPMWDTGAPGLESMEGYLSRRANPFNTFEPVDSSTAAIAAQGLLRLGHALISAGDQRNGRKYRQAGLTVAKTLFAEPYLSVSTKHQGLLLHSVYHRPNGWDYIAPGQRVPNGESSMWGDYHARELALMLLREIRGETPLCFFGSPNSMETTAKLSPVQHPKKTSQSSTNDQTKTD